jgi:hexulose-6-phosphate isomerase
MNLIGLYEKALPKNLPLEDKLILCKRYGFDYMQLSIDEDPARLERLNWDDIKFKKLIDSMLENGTRIGSLCVSANRKYPLGSNDQAIREKGVKIIKKAIDFAIKVGARNILTSGYDVFHEKKTVLTRNRYIENLKKCVEYAASKEVMLSIETMDDSFAKSISSIIEVEKNIPSPWLQIFADLGNLTAWIGNAIGEELERGINHITEIHFKDAISVSKDGKGKFRNVPFGKGNVDFEGCIATLKRLNYTGPYVIEMWGENSSQYEKAILIAKKFLDLIINSSYR